MPNKKIISLFLYLSFSLITNAADLQRGIDQIVQPLLEWKPNSALIIGVIDDGEQHIFSYGQISADNTQKPATDTVFEIGSITKVFTTILLSDMVLKNEVQLDDPLQKFFPESVTIPKKNNREITLLHLARHTSGLPRLAHNMLFSDPENPYVDYTVEQLHEFLNNVTLESTPGQTYNYSNIGVGILGHVLGKVAGSTYEQLLNDRIIHPLNMKSTGISITDEIRPRLAPGHKTDGISASNWDFTDVYAGAGAIRSTLDDMMIFLKANMGLLETPLHDAMEYSHSAHVADNYGSILLGWNVSPLQGNSYPMIWHNGQTGGYHSFLGFQRNSNDGVVILMNHAIFQVDEAGFNILRLLAGLTPGAIQIPEEPEEVSLDPSILDRYTGEYQLSPELAPNLIVTIRNEDNQLTLQITGQERVGLFPESETTFFMKAVEAKVSFHQDEQGNITHLILHQNGDHIGTRLSCINWLEMANNLQGELMFFLMPIFLLAFFVCLIASAYIIFLVFIHRKYDFAVKYVHALIPIAAFPIICFCIHHYYIQSCTKEIASSISPDGNYEVILYQISEWLDPGYYATYRNTKGFFSSFECRIGDVRYSGSVIGDISFYWSQTSHQLYIYENGYPAFAYDFQGQSKINIDEKPFPEFLDLMEHQD